MINDCHYYQINILGIFCPYWYMWVGTKLHGNLEILQKGTALHLPYQSTVKNK